MTEALARLWTKFLPDIEQRAQVIIAASRTLNTGSLSDEQRLCAHTAAHKLAGTLGMFGLPHGTELARKIELLLGEELLTGAASDLAVWSADLAALIQANKEPQAQ
jgi:HPt (histidine-containing phosphotransfer) domain-containing protein